MSLTVSSSVLRTAPLVPGAGWPLLLMNAPLDLKLTSTTTIGGMETTTQPVAVITGAGRGLGLALARALLARDWRTVVDAPRGAAGAARRRPRPPRPARQQRQRPRAEPAAAAGRHAAVGRPAAARD